LFAGMSLLSLCYLCIESTSSLSPFRCLALSVTHFGTFVVGLVVFRLAATAILWPGGRVKKEYLVLILVLSLLTSLSDAIFAIQFCAPVVIASIYLWAKCVIPWRRALIVASSTVAGTAGGFIVYNHLGLNLSWYFARADVSFLSRNASDLGRLFLHLWQTHPSWLVLCALVWVALFFMWAFVDKLEELGRPLSGPAKFLTAFCLASGGLALASCLPSSMTVAVRYFIPVFFLPVFLAPYVILVIKPGGLKIAAIGIWTVGVCAAAIFVLASNRQPFAFHANYYPKEIQCMDDAFQKYGLENGIAAYWDARRTVVLAKTEVNIAQVNYKLAMHLWNVSKKTFKDSYDFAIIDPGASPFYRLNEELIKAVNGEPSDTVLCGKRKILIYPKDGLRLRGGMMPRFIYEEGPGQ